MQNSIYGHENSSFTLKEALTVIFKYKTVILIVFTIVTTTAIGIAFMQPPVYEAKASVLLKIGREYLNRSELSESSKPVLSVNQEELTTSEIQILKNNAMMKNVVTRVGIDKIYPELSKNVSGNMNPLDVAAENLEKQITVEGVKKSNVLMVSFQHTDPAVAAKVVNTLIELFKEKHLQVYSDPKSSFLEKQLATYQTRLRDSEQNLQAYKQAHMVYSLDEQRTLLLEQRFGLDTLLKNSEHSIYESEKRIAYLKRQLKGISESKTRYTNSERDRIVVDAKSRLLALQLEEHELLKKYQDDNVLVANIRKETELVKNFIKEQEEDIYGKAKSSNVIYQNVEMELIKAETELTSQKGRLASLRQQLRQVDKNIQSLDLSEKGLQELKRDQQLNEKNYQIYLTKTEEARIAENMDRLKIANISVIQDAAVSGNPVKPNKLLYSAIGIVFGCISGVGVAFLSESRARTFSNPLAVERLLGVPVLAVVCNEEG
ncbi:GumC family protein [Geotalea sp. SG265]|uniref:GumC family protein n=1 Tax=Geotalea sp. SG265 TaxID=2922867 RepID=UPI00243523CE|nr:GumC family protein [Geotalea sp. SG265]